MKHNPDNVEPGEGYRLLDLDEKGSQFMTIPQGQNLIEGWDESDSRWLPYCSGANPTVFYRTRLSRAALRQARGLPPEDSQPEKCPTCSSTQRDVRNFTGDLSNCSDAFHSHPIKGLGATIYPNIAVSNKLIEDGPWKCNAGQPEEKAQASDTPRTDARFQMLLETIAAFAKGAIYAEDVRGHLMQEREQFRDLERQLSAALGRADAADARIAELLRIADVFSKDGHHKTWCEYMLKYPNPALCTCGFGEARDAFQKLKDEL